MATGLSQPQAAVFVVDDDAAVREGLAALFESVGLQVRTFVFRAGIPANKISGLPILPGA